jgi:hypothetical protein
MKDRDEQRGVKEIMGMKAKGKEGNWRGNERVSKEMKKGKKGIAGKRNMRQ